MAQHIVNVKLERSAGSVFVICPNHMLPFAGSNNIIDWGNKRSGSATVCGLAFDCKLDAAPVLIADKITLVRAAAQTHRHQRPRTDSLTRVDPHGNRIIGIAQINRRGHCQILASGNLAFKINAFLGIKRGFTKRGAGSRNNQVWPPGKFIDILAADFVVKRPVAD